MPPVQATAVPRLVHRAYAGTARVVRSNAALYRTIFGHWPAPEVNGQLWDWTTLALASALRSHVRPGASVLDIGTGPTGVLAVYAKHRLQGGRVCGVDHVAELLPSAANTAARCGAAVEFSYSSLFSSVHGRFDVIAFNAPYIPIEKGRFLGALREEVDERRWSGGVTGVETIERFLDQAPDHLERTGCILLGVNHFYLAPTTLRAAITDAGLTELSAVRHRLTQACAYVLGKGAVQKARTRNTPPETSTARTRSGA
jgi:release factor glutamine methyltransferase